MTGPVDPQVLLAAKRLYAAGRARDGLIDFARFMTPDPEHFDDAECSTYSVQPHHRLIAEALEEVFTGKNLRLLLSVPPQSGKSQLASRFGPAWFMGRQSWKNMILGTYNQDFANEFGDDVRSIIQSPQYKQVFPRMELRTGSKAKDHMVTTQHGKMSFLGRGGSGTGRPADLALIDDPLKDAKEAESLTIRNDLWEWFTKVIFTRCHVGSAIVVIQTRWHEDDLIGRITDPQNPCYDAEEAKKWTYLNIPAIMDDPRIASALGKKVGDALWPERFPLEHLESARKLNPRGFSALYMGRPTPPEGAFFKVEHLHTYEAHELPKDGGMYLSGDLALSLDAGDNSCVGNWRLCRDGILWLLPDAYWKRKMADESVEQIIAFIKTHKPIRGFWERGQIAKAVGPFLEKRMNEEGAYTNMEALPASGSKGAKASAIRGMMAAGRVRFPRFAPWWSRAKEQLLKFTGEGDREDDFVDMCSQIGQGLMKQIKVGPVTKKQDNVIRVGTMAWVVAEGRRQKRAEELNKGRLRAGGAYG